ncbi:replicative DNA helicase [Anaplasma marginale]|uniref:replicative DNA helicase n=1 Tax=Anaplasma marginale TaxID=770 RepID=UPI0003189EF8|nr:replicative DNA helicase [Anaplasma marginale]
MTLQEEPKPAPHSKESEMMVLGCMLTSINNLNVGAGLLNSDDFYYSENKVIFDVLNKCFNEGKPGDVHIVAEELKRKDQLKPSGGVAYLTTLAQYAGTSAYIEEYCEELKKCSYSRQSLFIHQSARKEFLENPDNPSKISEKYRRQLIDLDKGYSPNDKASIGEILSGNKSKVDPAPIIERLKLRQEFYKEHGKPCITGLPTGFVDIDKQVTILENTNLIVVAGRPSMGKTAFALGILSNICFDQGLPVGFISLEMGADQLTERLLSLRSGVPGEKLKRGTFTDQEFQKLQEEDKKLRKAKFFIHDQAISAVSQVASRARRLKDEEDIRILVVDYLQLLGTDSGNDSRQYEVAEVSRTMKQLARELEIPIIIVSQLSRKVEERSEKRPQLSDLRDSGQIEQDADDVLFVYRAEYYNQNEKPGEAEIIVAKNRHGSLCNSFLRFNGECGTFGNLYRESNSSVRPTIKKHKCL